MDSNQLKSFVSIARTLNFTEAAKLNFITQSAISRQMKELEDYLGVELFYRTKHSVTLTDEGKTFLRYAEEQLANEREICSILRNMSQGNLGMVKIASLPDLAYELDKNLAEFNSRHPTIQFTIDQVPGKRMGELLLEKQHNFYFATTDTFLRTHGYQYIRVIETHFVLLAHKSIAGRINTADISTFEKYPFALISYDVGPIFYDKIFAFCHSIGYSPLMMSYFNTGEAVMHAVNAGIGISISTDATARMCKMENVEILPFKHPHVALTGAIGWRIENLNNPSRMFLEVISDLYPENKYPVQQS